MPVQNRYRRKFGEVAQDLGYVTKSQLDEALAVQARRRAAGKEEKLLGQLLFELGYMSAAQLQAVVDVLFPPIQDPETG
jgi:hypothetical protein